MSLSIIIPVLNEAAQLPDLLDSLTTMHAEVIVADGGSVDDTPAIAGAHGVRLLHAARGRARQMHAGAQAANGDILLFLHADTRLPPHADTLVKQALADRQHDWGRFDVHITGRPRMLRVVAALMNRRSRLSGIATGDQAIFVRRSAYQHVGGFPDQPLMEDIELSRQLKKLSPPACLRCKVRTSGRRWEERGVWRTIFLMWRLRWAYWRGAAPEQLAEIYR